MRGRGVIGSTARVLSFAMLGTVLLTGCALVQPVQVRRMLGFGPHVGEGDADCAAAVSRAHVALAEAGAAGGDPAATAAAHAASAAAMSEYHSCLARRDGP